MEDNTIVLKKYEPACIFCGESRGIVVYKGRNICPACIRQIKDRL